MTEWPFASGLVEAHSSTRRSAAGQMSSTETTAKNLKAHLGFAQLVQRRHCSERGHVMLLFQPTMHEYGLQHLHVIDSQRVVASAELREAGNDFPHNADHLGV